MAVETGKWLSIHVFLADPVRTERYLRERLETTVERWRAEGVLDRWFFIRYWEGGPHLRIRLSGAVAEDEAGAIAALSEGIDEFRSDNPPTREDYYRGHSFDGRKVDEAELPWYAEGSVVRIDYEPEFVRYGGEDAIGASEELFGLSSRIALGVCRATQTHWAGRLSTAFGLMATALLASGERMGGMTVYFRDYGAFWASLVGREEPQESPPSPEQLTLLRQLEAQAEAGWEGRSVHVAWALGVQRLVGRLRELHGQGRLIAPHDGLPTVGDDAFRRAALGIVGSQIHMLNNRMGVPLAGERFLAGALARAADALSCQDAAA